jgi:ribonuclease P protein component
VRREGRSWSHPLLVLIASPNTLDGLRVGFTAGKSVGGAVQRNRAKRRLRAAVQALAGRLPAGWDLVWIARPGLPGADWPAVTEAVGQVLRRAKLLKDG